MNNVKRVWLITLFLYQNRVDFLMLLHQLLQQFHQFDDHDPYGIVAERHFLFPLHAIYRLLHVPVSIWKNQIRIVHVWTEDQPIFIK